MFTACVIQQNKDYARDFLRRIRFVYKRLPAWLQRPVVSDSRFELTFLSTSGEENVLRVIAGGDAAGRSLTADLTVFDEHARIPEAQSMRDGCEPALEVAKGQCIILSTSVGPHGDFYDVWRLAPANGYEPVFFGWRERPSRDEAWYARTAEKHKSNPSYMAREYPSSAEEAFLYARGKVLPRL